MYVDLISLQPVAGRVASVNDYPVEGGVDDAVGREEHAIGLERHQHVVLEVAPVQFAFVGQSVLQVLIQGHYADAGTDHHFFEFGGLLSHEQPAPEVYPVAVRGHPPLVV